MSSVPLASHEAVAELSRSLPKAPSAFSLTVRKLIGRVYAGAVRVPRFQWPLRWTNEDVLKLLDSILKGTPSGHCSSGSDSFNSIRLPPFIDGGPIEARTGQPRLPSKCSLPSFLDGGPIEASITRVASFRA